MISSLRREPETLHIHGRLQCTFSRELTEASLPRIGDEFGGRDHTTVMHACSKIQDDIQQDHALATSVKDIISKLKEMT